MQTCSSVPGSPTRQSCRRNSRSRRFSWRRNLLANGYCVRGAAGSSAFQRRVSELPAPPDYQSVVNGILLSRHRQQLALVTPCLDNLDLPYADAEDDCADGSALNGEANCQQQPQLTLPMTSEHGVELQTTSVQKQWMSHSGSVLGGQQQPVVTSALRRHSTLLQRSGSRRVPSQGGQHRARAMSSHHAEFASDRHRSGRAIDDTRRLPGGEPTHFRWNASVRIKKPKTTTTAAGDGLFVNKKSIGSVSGYRLW